MEGRGSGSLLQIVKREDYETDDGRGTSFFDNDVNKLHILDDFKFIRIKGVEDVTYSTKTWNVSSSFGISDEGLLLELDDNGQYIKKVKIEETLLKFPDVISMRSLKREVVKLLKNNSILKKLPRDPIKLEPDQELEDEKHAVKRIKLEVGELCIKTEFNSPTEFDIKNIKMEKEDFEEQVFPNLDIVKTEISVDRIKQEDEEEEGEDLSNQVPLDMEAERRQRRKGNEIVSKGDLCFVRRDNGLLYPSEVIETRYDNGVTEYYVHFIGLNRRLDEWVAEDRVSVTADTEELSNKVMADNFEDEQKKRKGKELVLETSLQNDNTDRKQPRSRKKAKNDVELATTPGYPDMDEEEAEREREHMAQTKVKNIEKIHFGQYEISTWYYSPYPEAYGRASKLFICEFCLKYMLSEEVYQLHCELCDHKGPPGLKIYEKDNIEVYEVDGADHKLYCQLLCLLAKLFLDHKTLFYEMDPFLFYVLCEVDEKGSHVVGYFSKEKESIDNNVACILVLPPYQRKGYGKFLIGFSYELSIREGLPGSPEKPLSDLGKLSYVSYWCYTLLKILNSNKANWGMSLDGMSEKTGIAHEDIIYTLQTLKLLKYWKSNTIAVLKPNTISELLKLPQYRAPSLLVDPTCLKWTPSETALNHAKMRKDL